VRGAACGVVGGHLATKHNFDNFALHESNLGNTHFTDQYGYTSIAY